MAFIKALNTMLPDATASIAGIQKLVPAAGAATATVAGTPGIVAIAAANDRTSTDKAVSPASVATQIDAAIDAFPSSPVTSVAGKTGAVKLVPADVGLGNVSNLTDGARTVGAANRLSPGRNIGGVMFDGSKDINLPGVNVSGNQNTSGRAATATTALEADALSDAVDMRVDLAKTTVVSFDGTANVNLGVTGVLAEKNGGTGLSSLDNLPYMPIPNKNSSGIGATVGMSSGRTPSGGQWLCWTLVRTVTSDESSGTVISYALVGGLVAGGTTVAAVGPNVTASGFAIRVS